MSIKDSFIPRELRGYKGSPRVRMLRYLGAREGGLQDSVSRYRLALYIGRRRAEGKPITFRPCPAAGAQWNLRCSGA